MKRLIVDSGSTKADWRLLSEEGLVLPFRTKGMNPFLRTAEELSREIEAEVLPKTGEDIGEIFFYGAGVVAEKRGNVIVDALSGQFPDAVISTYSDIMGAARALFGNNSGVACIMGTGSNACLYDGEKISAQIPPLGFILGDECSGSVLGRKLISDYFKKMMPAGIHALFEKAYAPDLAETLHRVYRDERPNRYLAGFTPFLSAHLDDPYCKHMVEESFRQFLERNVLRLPGVTGYPVGMVGSVAFHFREIFTVVLPAYGFDPPLILKEPIDGLTRYHQTSDR